MTQPEGTLRSFKDRVVVITGSASGIGRATAAAFAREGARLHLVDLNAPALEAAAAELGGVPHLVDCADHSAVEALAQAIYDREGRVDVLHNNAGVVSAGAVERTSIEDWRWVLGCNLWSVINGVTAFIPRMIAQGGGGHLVNTASMAGLIGLPRVAAYCASKFAVVGLTESLAAELPGRGIGVTLVCPGTIRTNLFRAGHIDLPESAHERLDQLMRRWAPGPERLAERIVEAVRRKQGLVVSGPELIPLWLLKRATTSGYLGLSRLVTTTLLGRVPTSDGTPLAPV